MFSFLSFFFFYLRGEWEVGVSGSRLLHPLFRLVELVIEMAMEWEPVSDAFLPFSLKVRTLFIAMLSF